MLLKLKATEVPEIRVKSGDTIAGVVIPTLTNTWGKQPINPIMRMLVPGSGAAISVQATDKPDEYKYRGTFSDDHYKPGAIVIPETEATKITTDFIKASIKADKGPGIKPYTTPLGGFSTPTLGTDPELFVVQAANPTQIIPAWAIESKRVRARCRITEAEIYPDGFGMELSTFHNYCIGYLVDGVRAGVKAMALRAKKHNGILCAQDVIDVPQEILDAEDDSHVQLGCAPSFNAYGDSPKLPNGRELTWRTIGTHFHFGATYIATAPDAYIQWLVRCMDAIGGVLCCAAWGATEDTRRRTLYGRAGEYRRPKHGVEYRVIGSRAMVHPTAYHFAATTVRIGLWLGMAFGPTLPLPPIETVRDIINTSDQDAAQKLVKRNPLYQFSLQQAFLGFTSKENKILQDLLTNPKGIGKHINLNPLAVENNWRINEGWAIHSHEGTMTFKNLLTIHSKVGEVYTPNMVRTNDNDYTEMY